MNTMAITGALTGTLAAFVLGRSLRNTGVLLSRALRARSRSRSAIAPSGGEEKARSRSTDAHASEARLVFTRAGLTGIVVLVLGCGSGLPYGSYLQDRPSVEAAMAADAAKKLSADYGSEQRLIWLSEEATDGFGRRLSAELRKVGFRVRSGPDPKARIDLAVRYVVDAVKDSALCRATLYVKGRTLSRAYEERGRNVYPAGPWVAATSVGGR